MTVRVAAVGDVHMGIDSAGTLRPQLAGIGERADLLLLAGDLTRHGDPAEARVLAEELEGLPVPIVAVLGNHDYQSDRQDEVRTEAQQAGITVLECESTIVEVGGLRIGVAGAKGFGGGFAGACATEFGEPQMKAFVRHTREIADRLENLLHELRTDVRIALLHYSPSEQTVAGERPPIHPFLGSHLLGGAIDATGADVVFHGHAHHGSERGCTLGGVPVRNVAQPLIGTAYAVFSIGRTTRWPRRAGSNDAHQLATS